MPPTINNTFTTYGNVGGHQGNAITTYSSEEPEAISVPATTDIQTDATQRQTPSPPSAALQLQESLNSGQQKSPTRWSKFHDRYTKMHEHEKWRLSTGTYVEDVIYRYVRDMTPPIQESHLEKFLGNFLVDWEESDDLLERFSPEDQQEIASSTRRKLPPLSSKLGAAVDQISIDPSGWIDGRD
ncbi:MAG: hypothetical protein Q9219_004802 [cf. Caloplaca sp. 3 TL-2023]